MVLVFYSYLTLSCKTVFSSLVYKQSWMAAAVSSPATKWNLVLLLIHFFWKLQLETWFGSWLGPWLLRIPGGEASDGSCSSQLCWRSRQETSQRRRGINWFHGLPTFQYSLQFLYVFRSYPLWNFNSPCSHT